MSVDSSSDVLYSGSGPHPHLETPLDNFLVRQAERVLPGQDPFERLGFCSASLPEEAHRSDVSNFEKCNAEIEDSSKT